MSRVNYLNSTLVKNINKLLFYTTKIFYMINVGLYYKVKEGHEREFEGIFKEVIEVLMKSGSGFVDGKLYKEIGNSREYLIYTEWKDLESFREFTSGRTFKDIQNYGKNILESMPRHRIFREEQF